MGRKATTRARSAPLRCAKPVRAAGDTLPALGRDWKTFYAWLTKQRYHRRNYANAKQFTVRVGNRISWKLGQLRRQRRKNRQWAAKLALMFLSLRARTVKGNGSRWDCITRMFQLTAQSRKLAGIGRISYSGSRGRRYETISGPDVYQGYRLTYDVLTLMWVDHYRQRRLSPRLMDWKTKLLKAGGVFEPAVYRGLAVGDILFYPNFGPGHFGVVMYRSQDFFLAMEGYWRGQPTVVHVYKRRETIPDRCVAQELAQLPGFRELLKTAPAATSATETVGQAAAVRGSRVVFSKNVYSGTILDKGETRVGVHK